MGDIAHQHALRIASEILQVVVGEAVYGGVVTLSSQAPLCPPKAAIYSPIPGVLVLWY
jgi:hypothetical protein